MGEPGDGVRLPAAGRMLDEIPLPCAVLARVSQEPAHHVELVVARPQICFLLFLLESVPRMTSLAPRPVPKLGPF